MSIYKRKGSPFFWYKFKSGGISVRESSGTCDAQQALRIEAKRRLELFERARLGLKPEHTWDEAVIGYLDTLPEGANKRNTGYTLKWLCTLLSEKRLSEIDEDLLTEIRDARVKEVNKRKREAARRGKPSRWPAAQPSYINRIFTGVVSPVLHYAKRRKWIAAVPEMPRMAETGRDPVWATREQVARLLGHLPQHQRVMCIFALEVGWRRSNVTHLTWAQVDLVRCFAWVKAQEAKAGKGLRAPLSEGAMAILREQQGLHSVWVFPYKGKPVEQTSTRAFRAARDAAGLPKDFTWHALRHTWASWHRQGGTPIDVLRDLGGWSNDRMVQRYAHLGMDHLRDFVDARVGVVEGGHKEGAHSKRGRSKKAAKLLIPDISGNSSVGRAQPCQGHGLKAPLEKSKV